MNPNIDLQDVASVEEKDIKKTAKGTLGQNEEREGDGEGRCWCWQKEMKYVPPSRDWTTGVKICQ